jgi:DNA-binding response OmpR family regulator
MTTITKRKVLLVDDDKDICMAMRSGLERHGFDVTTFDDPQEALLQFEAKLYDKIVLDLKMPGMTGVQLAKKIWALEPDAKVCFFSAFEMHERDARVLFKDLKNVQFIKKPILPNELARFIAENSTQR